MLFKTWDGSEIFYETYGNKDNPAVLLLHGIGADYKMWQPQIEKYPKQGYYVITMTLRAHGQSAKVNNLSLDHWTKDILHLIKHLDIEIYCLIGVSMGGVIAQHFISKYPNMAKRLVLCDTFGELKTVGEKLLGFSQIIGFKIFRLLGNKIFARAMSSAYKKINAKQAEKYFYNVSLNADFDQLLLARKAINKIDILNDLKTVNVPTLVLSGDKAGSTFIQINKKIADSLPNSQFKIIKGSMDPSNLVQQELFDKKVLEFLKE